MNLAPNGKPSNLTPEQYKLVRTPAFKAWFGDWENSPENNASKVVDENGEPLVVYHSTDEQFNRFNTNKIKRKRGTILPASYFAEKLLYAEKYLPATDEWEKNPKWGKIIIKAFLNIRHPLTFDFDKPLGLNVLDIQAFIKEGQWDTIKEKLAISNGVTKLKAQKLLSNYHYAEKDVKGKTIYEKGVIFKNTKYSGIKNNEFAVFSSNQIKLADGTNTTFDSKNPDIRFAGGGKIKNIFSLNNPEYKDAFLDRGDEDKETWKDYGKKSIKFIIDEIKELKFPLTIYRGVKEKYSENPSEFVENRSWTTDIYVAKRFSGGLGSVVSKIIGSDDIDYESTIKKRILYSSQDEYEIILNEKGEKIKPKVIQESKFYNGGELTITSEQVEKKLGRKLHWWNDDVVTINGTEYKKVFLKSEYKRL